MDGPDLRFYFDSSSGYSGVSEVVRSGVQLPIFAVSKSPCTTVSALSVQHLIFLYIALFSLQEKDHLSPMVLTTLKLNKKNRPFLLKDGRFSPFALCSPVGTILRLQIKRLHPHLKRNATIFLKQQEALTFVHE